MTEISPVEALIAPLRHSPLLPQALSLLQVQMQQELEARNRFYEEMTDDQKVEFIDGQVVMHSPARNQHLDVTKYVVKLLDTFVSLQGLGTVKSEKCLCVFPRNDYEPDVVFFGLEKTAMLTPETLKFPIPDLVVEVLSESTEERDRGIKFQDFSSNQVGEYWIIDADRKTLEQYVQWASEYEMLLKSSTGRLSSRVVANFEIDVEALFDEQKNLLELRRMLNDQVLHN